ncbi:MAG: hypothetical protein KY469_14565 [Actinobacteria bacterium]|nr:hypothetical protein [Actinomycetota bacterium]
MLAVAVPVVAAAAEGGATPGGVALEVLSSRADLVSGGDALVAVRGPARAGDVVVEVAGRQVPVRALPDGRPTALVDGLPLGTSTITARLGDGRGAALEVVNHPVEGPIFSGPHLEPFLCSTLEAGLGEATDEDCSAPTTFDFFYRSTVTGSFEPLEDPADPPSDVATTTTDESHTLPYIVRRERGVIDRAIYDIAVLYDPQQPDWSPWIDQRGWNGKLYWKHGGNGYPDHRQLLPADVLDHRALSRGWAVASTSFSILGNNFNTVTSAESTAMVKEHLTESYGVPRFTVGIGCSGGSVNVHQIAESYPGLYDGILPYCSFPDDWSPVQQYIDCDLLERYMDRRSPHLWADHHARNAVMGEVLPTVCSAWAEVFAFGWQLFDPRFGCVGGDLPDSWGMEFADRPVAEQPDWVYDPNTNPDGVRCTVQDFMSNVYGNERADGFAGRPYDNIGVQYGLGALEDGAITVEQFVDMNEKIGGFDIDYRHITERTAADPEALRIAYQAGRVTHGSRGLSETAIIDFRVWSPAEVHSDYHSFTMRERLVRANGHADNHVIVRAAGAGFTPTDQTTDYVFGQMDRWLTNVEADTSDAPKAVRIARARSEDLVDVCFPDGNIAGQGVTDPETCRTAMPYGASPRIVSGAPATNDVLKCQLEPLDRGDYDVTFTDAQWARMQAAFPDGVCDYNKPGVSQQPPIGTWPTFNDGPGGRPLGPAPTSTPLGAARVAASTEAASQPLPTTGASGSALAAALLLLAGPSVRERRRR